jgi:hypothetical protein
VTEEGVWGIPESITTPGKRKAKHVHFFIESAAICNEGPTLYQINENWDPNDPLTCPKCRERHRWIEKGFHFPTNTVPHRPAPS